MNPPDQSSRRPAKLLAFLQRAFILRPFRRRTKSGQNVERRATRWLEMLNNPSDKLAWRIKLENLAFEADLLIEERALDPECLKLQLLVMQLANDYPAAAEMRDLYMNENRVPMTKLLYAIVKQAVADGMSAVRIAFTEAETHKLRTENARTDPDPSIDIAKVLNSSNAIDVFFLKGDRWIQAMTVPLNLAPPLRGTVLRVDAALCANLQPPIDRDGIPVDITFIWETPDLLRMTLSTPKL